MSELQTVLMQRDGLTETEAAEQIAECRADFNDRIASGGYPDEILQEYFGLEPDYIFDLM